MSELRNGRRREGRYDLRNVDDFWLHDKGRLGPFRGIQSRRWRSVLQRAAPDPSDGGAVRGLQLPHVVAKVHHGLQEGHNLLEHYGFTLLLPAENTELLSDARGHDFQLLADSSDSCDAVLCLVYLLGHQRRHGYRKGPSSKSYLIHKNLIYFYY